MGAVMSFLARNMERDKEQCEELMDAGRALLIVWEEDLKRKSTWQGNLDKIRVFLES